MVKELSFVVSQQRNGAIVVQSLIDYQSKMATEIRLTWLSADPESFVVAQLIKIPAIDGYAESIESMKARAAMLFGAKRLSGKSSEPWENINDLVTMTIQALDYDCRTKAVVELIERVADECAYMAEEIPAYHRVMCFEHASGDRFEWLYDDEKQPEGTKPFPAPCSSSVIDPQIELVLDHSD